MSLFFSPAQVVPAVFVLEVLASISMLRSVWREIDWGWLKPLLIGNAIAIPGPGVDAPAWTYSSRYFQQQR